MLYKSRLHIKKFTIFSVLFMLLVSVMLLNFQSDTVYAAQTEITLENAGDENSDGEIHVNVEIKSVGNIGAYQIELKYDTDRLKYISGAESEHDGIITLTGTGFGKEIVYNLIFHPISGGRAEVVVNSAHIYSVENDGSEYSVGDTEELYIDIKGNDITDAGTSLETVENINFAGAIQDGEKLLKVVDIADYEPQMQLWNYKVITDNYNDGKLTFLTDNARNIRVVLALDENQAQYLYAYNSQSGRYYPVTEMKFGSETYYIMSVNSCLEIPDGMTDEEKSDVTIFYAVNNAGDGGYYRYTLDGELIQWTPNITSDKNVNANKNTTAWTVIAIIATVALSAALVTAIYFYIIRRHKRNKTGKIKSGLREKIDLFNVNANDRKQYFFVIRELTAREIKRKYARSYLGILWSVLNPLLTMAVMSVIFSYMFKRSIENYAIYYLTGNIFWTLFSVATNSAMTALVDNKMLLIKAKLPKQTFVLSRVYTSLVNFGYTCIAYLLMLLVFRIKPSWTMLLFIPDVILALLFATGIGYMLSILYVFFADIKYLYGVALTLFMYMSAIFYPVSSLPPTVQKIVGLNPIYLTIYIARESVVYNRVPHYSAWIKLIVAVGISLSLGLLIFKKKENDVMQRV